MITPSMFNAQQASRYNKELIATVDKLYTKRIYVYDEHNKTVTFRFTFKQATGEPLTVEQIKSFEECFTDWKSAEVTLYKDQLVLKLTMPDD